MDAGFARLHAPALMLGLMVLPPVFPPGVPPMAEDAVNAHYDAARTALFHPFTFLQQHGALVGLPQCVFVDLPHVLLRRCRLPISNFVPDR
jgi:hypothetical protein